ncbi:hypothetical protein [Flavobacterium limi]|uniref:Uncharacterized protein n=1 Tax=Flavobacterium limi TaxID=2045105 RepID=A0ABQ1U508_9FLAO|nr:hypothetical protein [Flavobacterium limi]GGF08508.1 hypothetical protein GCM10011518_17160 [Flavobacterium limi]
MKILERFENYTRHNSSSSGFFLEKNKKNKKNEKNEKNVLILNRLKNNLIFVKVLIGKYHHAIYVIAEIK